MGYGRGRGRGDNRYRTDRGIQTRATRGGVGVADEARGGQADFGAARRKARRRGQVKAIRGAY